MKKVFCKKGVTLMELLIVIAIIGIMISVVFAFSFENKKRAEVRAVADELVQRINDMRQRALKGDVGVGTSSACGFGILFPPPATQGGGYETFYISSRNTTSCEVDASSKTILFSRFNEGNRIRVLKYYTNHGPLPGEEHIFFNAPFATSQVDLKDIVVKFEDNTQSIHVCISDSGVAEVKDSCPS